MATYKPVTKTSLGIANVDDTSDATKNSATVSLTNKTIVTPTIEQINNATAPGVKLQVRTQTDNSNTIANATTAGFFVQYGTGQVLGNSAATLTDTVTFPTAFTTVLGVVVTPLGANSGVAADITSFSINYSGGTTAIAANAYGISTTVFTPTFTRNAGTFANTLYWGYSWIAWGI